MELNAASTFTNSGILGVGAYRPRRVVPNSDIIDRMRANRRAAIAGQYEINFRGVGVAGTVAGDDLPDRGGTGRDGAGRDGAGRGGASHDDGRDGSGPTGGAP